VRRGHELGRVGGIPVVVGASWLIVVPIVGIALFAGVEPRLGPLWARVAVAGLGTVLLFASVVIHELGHAGIARRRGVAVDRVVVFLFGGYSEMDLETARPADDIAISLAGPAASMALAALTVVGAIGAPAWSGTRRTLALLAIINLGVALFNLLPGFPLDGGRIVRALLMEAGVGMRRAEVITARLGVLIGAVAIGLGLWFSGRGESASLVAVPVGVLVVVIAAAAHPRREQIEPGLPPQEVYEEI
jgi:Zn-dependent protease